MRQDPDIIMIGEIRDSATAQLAIQAAQTGHLVLSTLHTRNARGALTRLKSLGLDQEALESCLCSVSSQRLVRKICRQCLGRAIEEARKCSACKGTGSYGRIGVHEVLGATHLFDPSLKHPSMYEAGLHYVKAGLIQEVDLETEVGTWH